MTQSDDFQIYDPTTTKALPEFQTATSAPDKLWADRITPIPVGGSFTINRPADETQRAFKKRINRAAMVSFKTLEWKSRDGNLPDDVEPTHWLVKVKALDLKAQAAAAAAAAKTPNVNPNGATQNTPTEATSAAQSAPDNENGQSEGSESATAQRGPRGR